MPYLATEGSLARASRSVLLRDLVFQFVKHAKGQPFLKGWRMPTLRRNLFWILSAISGLLAVSIYTLISNFAALYWRTDVTVLYIGFLGLLASVVVVSVGHIGWRLIRF